jgi:hypothetical protein
MVGEMEQGSSGVAGGPREAFDGPRACRQGSGGPEQHLRGEMVQVRERWGVEVLRGHGWWWDGRCCQVGGWRA